MKGANRAAMVLSLMLALSAKAQEEPVPEPPKPDTDMDRVIDELEFAGDTDADGLVDMLDVDDDGDGILTQFELSIGPDDDGMVTVAFLDTDGDMIPNHRDTDDDGDGILTADETPDPNHDGNPSDALATSQPPDSSQYLANYLSADDDSDGVPTKDERPNGMDRDTDADGVPDHLDDDDDNDGIRREYIGNTDGDAWPDPIDPDDDNDTVPTLEEVTPQQRDTDEDGKLDHVDADDDGDGIETILELGSGPTRRDTDGDRIPDFLENDDDGDGLLTIAERMLGDHDDDGIVDYLDLDDDGDTINTVIERAYSEDPDGDGIPNWYDLDSDGDGLSDAEEGLGDSDGDGIPNFLDRVFGNESDAGTSVRDAGGGGTGGGDAAVADGGVDAAIDGGGGAVVPPTSEDDDSGCTIGRRDHGAASLWLLVLGFVAWLCRRRRAVALVAGITIAGCDSDDDGGTSVPLDGSTPGFDAGQRDTGASDATTPISDAQIGSECTVEGDVLAQAFYEEPAERAFAATMVGDTVHVVYVAPVCTGIGNASGTSIDYFSFRSTGAFGTSQKIASDPEGTCRIRRSPAIAPNGEGGLALYFTANLTDENELYRQNIAENAAPIRLSTDIAADDELYTVAQTLGEGPLLAYTNQYSDKSAGDLVTCRPGGAEKQVVQFLQGQAPARLALLTFPSGSGGAIGWVDGHSSVPAVRVRGLDRAGSPVTEPVDLTTSVGSASAIAFAGDETLGGVAYTVQNGKVGELWFRRLDAQGLPVGREINLTSPNRSVTSISMAVYAKGFVIAFREVPVEIGLPASFRLMFIADNGAVAAERRLADATLSGAPTSQIFVAPDGRLIALWSDYGEGAPLLHVMRVRCL